MKKCQVRNEEMEAELMHEGIMDIRIFAMDISNHSENFAIPAKFRYAQFFAVIANFRYRSKNYYA